MEYNVKQLKEMLLEAVRVLYQKDYSLIRRGACERSIAFRLGVILDGMFPNHNVDSEYNLNVIDPKYIDSNENRRLTYPDIIVHNREMNNTNNSENNNLMIMEIKSNGSYINTKTMENDKMKLNAFWDAPYYYKLGVHICIQKTRAVVVFNSSMSDSKEINYFKYNKKMECLENSEMFNIAFLRHGRYVGEWMETD